METAKIEFLRDSKTPQDEVVKEIRKEVEKYGFDGIVPIFTDEIVVGEWVNLKCQYGCSQFNRSWCCPPVTPDLEKARRILGEYDEALLIVGTQEFPEFYHNNHRKRAKQVRYWKGIVSLERMLFLKGFYKAFSLVGMTCALCKTCSYPEPCVFPQDKRPTVESFSIDLISTLKRFDLASPIANHRKMVFNNYSIILLQ